MRTAPGSPPTPICTSLTMPSSGSGRLISGSWTVASAAFTASSAGDPVSVSDMRDVSPSTGSLRCGTRPCSGPARWRVATVRRGARPTPASGCDPGGTARRRSSVADPAPELERDDLAVHEPGEVGWVVCPAVLDQQREDVVAGRAAQRGDQPGT